ncbi:MAG: ribonuclease E/G, partial [Henriciella sp.]
MNKTMLIGAGHPEETRVALVENGQIQDFDLETSGSEQLRGSIYLAKVTRVEPSLQACFVDYGGNRHGFLAFSEIHPDYYQLPQEDRDRILEEAAREAAESDDDFDDQLENSDDSDEDIIISPSEDDTDNADTEATEEQDSSDENNNDSSDSADEEDAQTDSAEASDDG